MKGFMILVFILLMLWALLNQYWLLAAIMLFLSFAVSKADDRV